MPPTERGSWRRSFPWPTAVIGGLKTSANPFSLCPSYLPLVALPLAERVAALRDPAL